MAYSVNVTNTGTVDSDDVVLGFMVPPGAGTGGVPLQALFSTQFRLLSKETVSSKAVLVYLKVF